MSLRFLIILFSLSFPALAFAQQDTLPVPPGDTLHTQENTISHDASKSIMALDTAVKRFNPRVAVLRSALIPGWGQWYNKKYWKIPLVYGALGITAGVFFYNLKTYKQLRLAVIYRSDTDTSNDSRIPPEFQSLPTDFLRANRNVFRQNIDYSVLAFLGFWALNVVDASVDAHLKAFDVSPDIGLKIKPALDPNINGGSLSLVFFIKDKPSSHKTLLP